MTSQFSPPVDIYEDNNKLSLKMDVPGADTKDLDIRVDGNLLTVSGERKFESEEKKENFRRVEREYGSFRDHLRCPLLRTMTTSPPVLRMARSGSRIPNGPIREQNRSRLLRVLLQARKLHS